MLQIDKRRNVEVKEQLKTNTHTHTHTQMNVANRQTEKCRSERTTETKHIHRWMLQTDKQRNVEEKEQLKTNIYTDKQTNKQANV